MILPNFLIIGAQKAGTTWLLHQLRKHPEVFMPPEEVHFFDKAYNYAKGITWYRQFFDDAREGQIVGEKTPDYCWTNRQGAEGHLPSVHRNIHETLPDAKIILIVRDPIDRAVSAVNHLFRTKRIPPGYSIDRLLVGDKQELITPHGVLDYGRYYKHIQAYLECFDRDQLLILVFEEDVIQQPDKALRKVTRFLDVDPSFSFSGLSDRSNSPGVSKVGLYLRYYFPVLTPAVHAIDKYLLHRNYKKYPTDDTLQTLYDHYRPKNEKLYEFLGRRIPSWFRSDSLR